MTQARRGTSSPVSRMVVVQQDKNPFRVNLSPLIYGRADVLTIHAEGLLTDVSMPFAQVPADAKVRIDVDIEKTGESFFVSGRAVAPWVGECRRCLERAEGRVSAQLGDIYTRHPKEEEYPLEASFLDLSLVARDALLVELPLAPVCSASCLGLCVQCGANLNDGPCGCLYL